MKNGQEIPQIEVILSIRDVQVSLKLRRLDVIYPCLKVREVMLSSCLLLQVLLRGVISHDTIIVIVAVTVPLRMFMVRAILAMLEVVFFEVC